MRKLKSFIIVQFPFSKLKFLTLHDLEELVITDNGHKNSHLFIDNRLSLSCVFTLQLENYTYFWGFAFSGFGDHSFTHFRLGFSPVISSRFSVIIFPLICMYILMLNQKKKKKKIYEKKIRWKIYIILFLLISLFSIVVITNYFFWKAIHLGRKAKLIFARNDSIRYFFVHFMILCKCNRLSAVKRKYPFCFRRSPSLPSQFLSILPPLYLCIFVCIPVCPSVCLHVCLSLRLCICLFACLSILRLSPSVCLFAC